MTMNIGLKEVSRKHGGRDGTPKICLTMNYLTITMPVLYLTKEILVNVACRSLLNQETQLCQAKALTLHMIIILLRGAILIQILKDHQ